MSEYKSRSSSQKFFSFVITSLLDAYSGNELAYSELRFLKITRQDEAEYQCIVKNSYGTAYSDRARLLVRQLPEFLDVPHDIVTVAGRNIGFPCRAAGIPQPIISWEKDSSKTFPAAIERRMHIIQDDHSLYILNVSKADAGFYTCSAANDVGEVGVSARLEVYGRVEKIFFATKELFIESGNVYIETKRNMDIAFLMHPCVVVSRENKD
jgi:hypothetical protein